MLTTIVALYDTTQAARDAADALERGGYLRADIHMATYEGASQEAEARNAAPPRQTAWEWLIESLNASPPQDGMGGFEGLTAGQCVVSIKTTDEAAPGAVDILHGCGCVDLHGHMLDLHRPGVTSRAVAPADRQ